MISFATEGRRDRNDPTGVHQDLLVHLSARTSSLRHARYNSTFRLRVREPDQPRVLFPDARAPLRNPGPLRRFGWRISGSAKREDPSHKPSSASPSAWKSQKDEASLRRRTSDVLSAQPFDVTARLDISSPTEDDSSPPGFLVVGFAHEASANASGPSVRPARLPSSSDSGGPSKIYSDFLSLHRSFAPSSSVDSMPPSLTTPS